MYEKGLRKNAPDEVKELEQLRQKFNAKVEALRSTGLSVDLTLTDGGVPPGIVFPNIGVHVYDSYLDV